MVTPISLEAHVAICDVDSGMDVRYVGLFSKYWNEGHFLLQNPLYVNNEKDLLNEPRYHKGRLMEFINNMGYKK